MAIVHLDLKDKYTDNDHDLQDTTQLTKDRTTRIQLKTEGEPMCVLRKGRQFLLHLLRHR
jgi:hypothetical protein